MQHPLVSIITSTFNSEQTVGKTIESVIAQTYDNIEYIIADGESTDHTIKVVESYRHRLEDRGIRYTVLCSKDTGMYAGMNKGIAVAKGELIGIVNSDDFYEPNMIETVVEEYNRTQFDLFYANLNIVDGDGRKIREKKSRKMKYYLTTRHWNHPTTFVPKRIYDIRRYDESFQYYGDWDFMLWIFKHYDNIDVFQKPLSNYKLGGKTTHPGIGILKEKCMERRRGYRNYGYSPLYFWECMFMDFGKEAVMRFRLFLR